MNIDNLVTDHRVKENLHGKPYIVDVELREEIDGLFTNDTVQWLGEDWRVWWIGGESLTLIRRIDA